MITKFRVLCLSYVILHGFPVFANAESETNSCSTVGVECMTQSCCEGLVCKGGSWLQTCRGESNETLKLESFERKARFHERFFCEDIVVQMSNSPYDFGVSLRLKNIDPNNSNSAIYMVTVDRKVTSLPPHRYEFIGEYEVKAIKFPDTSGDYDLQFEAAEGSLFTLGILNYGVGLPWANLDMTTNLTGNEESIKKQLMCSTPR